MKIMIYCQHVLGIGHLARMAVIVRELGRHQVDLVLGGPETEFSFPDGVRVHRLPGLCMDAEFSGLRPVDPGADLETVKVARARRLLDLVDQLRPDLLLVELFPFGRCGFRFELDPLLEHVRSSHPACRVVSSVRDILVERDNQDKFETRAVKRLNRFFDLVLVHGDSRVIRLDETFSRLDQVRVPVRYTGYVAETAPPATGVRLRSRLALEAKQRLVVVSAGSGSVGRELLDAALAAYPLLNQTVRCRMQVFTGPYLDEAAAARLTALAGPDIRVERFSNRFPHWLAAADLSLSLGGYNTTMNVVAAGCPGLFLPFARNREQRLRLVRLQKRLPLGIVEQDDLDPRRLTGLMTQHMGRRPRADGVDLAGAVNTARILTEGAWHK